MQINKNIAISDSGFVFNPLTGDTFSTNHVGQEILKKLQSGIHYNDLVKHIESTFSVDTGTIEKDLNDYLFLLKSYQILIEEGNV